jgi:hypothetical protein
VELQINMILLVGNGNGTGVGKGPGYGGGTGGGTGGVMELVLVLATGQEGLAVAETL